MFTASLVVPCYNEEIRFNPELFGEFLREHPMISCLFVNDGSTDGTEAILEGFCQNRFNASYINMATNGGKAEAVRMGMLHVLATEARYVGYWDADLATPLDEVLNFLDVFAQKPEIELVTGARVQLLGRDIQRRKVRHYAGRIFATVTSMVLEIPMYDTQCGAKLFKVSKDLTQIFSTRFRSRWIFDVEILVRMRPSINQVYELPLQSWRDVGESKVTSFAFIKAVYELVLIYREKKKQHSYRKDPHSDSP